MSYATQEEFIKALTTTLSLPMEVTGTIEVVEYKNTNKEITQYINLINIKKLSGARVLLPAGQVLDSVLIDRNNQILIELNGKTIKAQISLNSNSNSQKIAFERNIFSRLLICNKDSISEYLVEVYPKISQHIERELMSKYKLTELEKALEQLEITDQKLKEKDDLIQESMEELNEKQKELDAFEAQINDMQKELEELTKNKDNLNDTIGNLQNSTNEIKERIDELDNKLNLLIKFGLIKREPDTINSSSSTISIEEFMTDGKINYPLVIDYIHAFILNNNIYYDRDTILDFFALVRTHDFIVLAGKSGIGKTSLVKQFAKAVNGRYAIIPVKPNWMSKEDLLGYYNPIQRQYISTEFLDILIEAENNPNTPYFICLDEMNLARVEYYFADFLSKMEERGENPIQIELYSKDIYPQISELINILKDKNPADISPDTILKQQELVAFIKNYYQIPADKQISVDEMYALFINIIPRVMPTVSIGHNVHFFGTANIDDSTHYFSPKVLDRVQVLKFDNKNLFQHHKTIHKLIDEYKRDSLKLNSELLRNLFLDPKIPINLENHQYQILCTRQSYQYLESKTNDYIEQINNSYLSKMNIDFGYRLLLQANHYNKQLEEFFTNLGPIKQKNEIIKYAISGFLAHKIFPQLSIKDETMLNSLKALLQYIQLENLSNNAIVEEIEKIISYCEDNEFYGSYWSI